MTDDKIDVLYQEFRDLLQECPEAERAIRDYRALRGVQSRDATIARMHERERRHHEEAWDALYERLRASGLGITDSVN